MTGAEASGWPDWSDWDQWLQRCAILRCELPVRARLRRMADHRFRRHLARRGPFLRAADAGAFALTPEDAWHRLEVRLVTGRGGAGKTGKCWLRARAEGLPPDAARAAVESGASLICRDAARDYIRLEVRPAATVSFDDPVRPGSTLTWGDLLPSGAGWGADPAAAVAARDLAERAGRCAAEHERVAEHPVRIAWLARALGLSLADPAVLSAAGLGKSQLFRLLNADVEALAERCRRAAGGVPAEALDLALRSAAALRRRARAWGAGEKALRPLFDRAGRTPEGAAPEEEKATP
jgi:hypothetical protein